MSRSQSSRRDFPSPSSPWDELQKHKHDPKYVEENVMTADELERRQDDMEEIDEAQLRLLRQRLFSVGNEDDDDLRNGGLTESEIRLRHELQEAHREISAQQAERAQKNVRDIELAKENKKKADAVIDQEYLRSSLANQYQQQQEMKKRQSNLFDSLYKRRRDAFAKQYQRQLDYRRSDYNTPESHMNNEEIDALVDQQINNIGPAGLLTQNDKAALAAVSVTDIPGVIDAALILPKEHRRTIGVHDYEGALRRANNQPYRFTGEDANVFSVADPITLIKPSHAYTEEEEAILHDYVESHSIQDIVYSLLSADTQAYYDLRLSFTSRYIWVMEQITKQRVAKKDVTLKMIHRLSVAYDDYAFRQGIIPQPRELRTLFRSWWLPPPNYREKMPSFYSVPQEDIVSVMPIRKLVPPDYNEDDDWANNNNNNNNRKSRKNRKKHSSAHNQSAWKTIHTERTTRYHPLPVRFPKSRIPSPPASYKSPIYNQFNVILDSSNGGYSSRERAIIRQRNTDIEGSDLNKKSPYSVYLPHHYSPCNERYYRTALSAALGSSGLLTPLPPDYSRHNDDDDDDDLSSFDKKAVEPDLTGMENLPMDLIEDLFQDDEFHEEYDEYGKLYKSYHLDGFDDDKHQSIMHSTGKINKQNTEELAFFDDPRIPLNAEQMKEIFGNRDPLTMEEGEIEDYVENWIAERELLRKIEYMTSAQGIEHLRDEFAQSNIDLKKSLAMIRSQGYLDDTDFDGSGEDGDDDQRAKMSKLNKIFKEDRTVGLETILKTLLPEDGDSVPDINVLKTLETASKMDSTVYQIAQHAALQQDRLLRGSIKSKDELRAIQRERDTLYKDRIKKYPKIDTSDFEKDVANIDNLFKSHPNLTLNEALAIDPTELADYGFQTKNRTGVPDSAFQPRKKDPHHLTDRTKALMLLRDDDDDDDDKHSYYANNTDDDDYDDDDYR